MEAVTEQTESVPGEKVVPEYESAPGEESMPGNEAMASEPPAQATDWEEMEPERTMELQFANQFSVDYYPGGYKKITITDDQRFLLIPEGSAVPTNLEEGLVCLQQPLNQIYLVATAAMDYFVQLQSVDRITLSSQKESGWYLDPAREAMESGQMLYAGKYSTPDYELIVSEGCDLAIENTMIYHTPEVLEQLDKLGIPAMVEKSSYETNPLGRMEWLKFYAALLDQEETAETYFDELTRELQTVIDQEPTDLKVAFFYINSQGAVNVRKSGDYVAKSIELAGGQYVSFDESEEENALSTMTIQMETFYSGARDADILIYNSTIDGELQTMDQLLQKSSLLADFKAVQAGNVWCIEKNFYQESLELGNMILDINRILTDQDTEEASLHFLHKLK
ncbi:MAG: ABC transporter substrate-binding protein [Parasporobacterium sp.]|nr:ABC transporter substrate-binding protein [Parasporobacterium sp.]